jgi:hypothetical protein
VNDFADEIFIHHDTLVFVAVLEVVADLVLGGVELDGDVGFFFCCFRFLCLDGELAVVFKILKTKKPLTLTKHIIIVLNFPRPLPKPQLLRKWHISLILVFLEIDFEFAYVVGYLFVV